MTQKKKILIVDGDRDECREIQRILESDGDRFIVYTAEPSSHAVHTIYNYNEPPDLVIISDVSEDGQGADLCAEIKSKTAGILHLPIILLLEDSGRVTAIDWERIPADDFLVKPLDLEKVGSRISLALARAARAGDANPLTRLPGNHSIMKAVQARIDSDLLFAVAYVDLDNFKSYNDKYGFIRGDEIIKVTARILTNSIRPFDSPHAFVGHVGGDDFVFIVPTDRLDRTCAEVIKHFDQVIKDFYDEEDRIRGYIDSTNRKGEKERFPIISLSIAVVTNEYRPIDHIGQVIGIAAEVKKRVKSLPGSNYLKDLRGSKDQSVGSAEA